MTQTTFDYDTAAADFYRELDADDHAVFRRRLTPDAVFAFNDVDPVIGVDAIANFIGAWKSNFVAITHDIHHVTVDPNRHTIGVEVTVSYVFENKVVKLEGCSFLEFAGELIRSYRVYIDTTQLS